MTDAMAYQIHRETDEHGPWCKECEIYCGLVMIHSFLSEAALAIERLGVITFPKGKTLHSPLIEVYKLSQ